MLIMTVFKLHQAPDTYEMEAEACIYEWSKVNEFLGNATL